MNAQAAFFLLVSMLVCGGALATDLDFKGVFFKEGLPAVGGDLNRSTVMFDDYVLPVLKDDSAGFLNLKLNAKVKIVGFTDNQECAGEACTALSMRRAQLVNDWLLAHGFPADRLLAPEGHGSSEPIDNNATAKGRQRNRRAEFQIVTASGQP